MGESLCTGVGKSWSTEREWLAGFARGIGGSRLMETKQQQIRLAKCDRTGHGPLVRMMAAWSAIARADRTELSLLQMRWVGWLEITTVRDVAGTSWSCCTLVQ